MKVFIMVALALLAAAQAWAAPFWLVNGGSNGTGDKSSIGVEVGGTRIIANRFPLSGEFSMNFDFRSIPSDTFLNVNRYDEPYTVRTVSYGPEFGYLFKSGVNLDDWVNNLTLQLGVGYSLQSKINIGTGSVTGKHWQQGDRETDVNPVGYGGLLYRIDRLAVSLGYNNRRGVVAGIGSSW